MSPPVSDDVLDEVRLSLVRGVGPMIRGRLIEAFGSAGAALQASGQEICSVRGVGPALREAISLAPSGSEAADMLQAASLQGIRVLTPATEEYPAGLREIHDPPPVLYCRGEIDRSDRLAVAIVGTRRATRYGIRQAEYLARELARAGVTVVSGLARGIDGAAHRAAIDAGGRTIAALAGGLSTIYPPEHAELAEQVVSCGALLAESPPPMPPMSGSFPQRNRIISGLSLGVVVVEAADRSGALITARHAAEQGRDAFAVPGPIDSPQSRGCHGLIQEGAKLVRRVDDILEEIEEARSLHACAVEEQPAAEFSMDDWPEPDQQLFAAIGVDATTIDQLVESTGMPVHEVLAGLSRLETVAAVQRLSGVAVCRNRNVSPGR